MLIGGGQNEVDLTRQVLKSRWPYPITQDKQLILDEQDAKKQPKVWLFKMKRQPWAISYGNKQLDRVLEMAQTVLKRPLRPPKNMDADSGKSVLVFLLKVNLFLIVKTQRGIAKQPFTPSYRCLFHYPLCILIVLTHFGMYFFLP
jgi:hypothetical protein